MIRLFFHLYALHNCYYELPIPSHIISLTPQVMLQLLYFFSVENEVDSLDWATIAIYTCESSCDSVVAYMEEFPLVQLYS